MVTYLGDSDDNSSRGDGFRDNPRGEVSGAFGGRFATLVAATTTGGSAGAAGPGWDELNECKTKLIGMAKTPAHATICPFVTGEPKSIDKRHCEAHQHGIEGIEGDRCPWRDFHV